MTASPARGSATRAPSTSRAASAATPGGYYSTSPPGVSRDLVIIGGHVTDNVSEDEPSGVIRAYDVRDGHLVELGCRQPRRHRPAG